MVVDITAAYGAVNIVLKAGWYVFIIADAYYNVTKPFFILKQETSNIEHLTGDPLPD